MPEDAESPKPPKSPADKAQEHFHQRAKSKKLLDAAQEESAFGEKYKDPAMKHLGLLDRLRGLTGQNPNPNDPEDLPVEPRN